MVRTSLTRPFVFAVVVLIACSCSEERHQQVAPEASAGRNQFGAQDHEAQPALELRPVTPEHNDLADTLEFSAEEFSSHLVGTWANYEDSSSLLTFETDGRLTLPDGLVGKGKKTGTWKAYEWLDRPNELRRVRYARMPLGYVILVQVGGRRFFFEAQSLSDDLLDIRLIENRRLGGPTHSYVRQK